MMLNLLIFALMQCIDVQGNVMTVDKFDLYPGYEGGLTVGGNVAVSNLPGELKFSYSFTGLRANSTGGWHVHSGTSCQDASLVLGHYQGELDHDPWKGNMWVSDSDGNSVGEKIFNNDDLGGAAEAYGKSILLRTIVVHDSDNEKISCSNIPTETVEFGKYPGYSGSLSISGEVTINGADYLDLTYSFSGLPANSTGGWHIHEGHSCSVAMEVGGHFNPLGGEDPWKDITYTSDGEGNAIGTVTVQGNEMGEINGRVVVVHSGNEKVACAEIYDTDLTTKSPTPAPVGPSLTVNKLDLYPGYTGGQTVSGDIGIFVKSGELKFVYSFEGLRPNSTGGWHVHTGTSCSDHSLVLGHYQGKLEDDPWKGNMWVSDMAGHSSDEVVFTDNQLGNCENYFNEILLRTIVVHDDADHEGARIACSNIPTKTMPFTKYPGYEGDIVAAGTVIINGKDDSLELNYKFSGLENSATGGWHIHEGNSCEVAGDIGGHFKGGNEDDPWADIEYTSDVSGNAEDTVSVTGNKMEDINNRVVVIHASDNTKVACAEIPHTVLPEPESPVMSPTAVASSANTMRIDYALPMLLLFFYSFLGSCSF